MEMNQEALKKRKLKAVSPDDYVESEYRGYMQKIIKEMAEEVRIGLLPIIKRNKHNYIGDAKVIDGWSDDVTAFFDAFRAKWTSFLFRNKVRTDIQRPLSMAESNTTAQFLKNVNEAVGVDVSSMLKSEGIENIMTSALQENLSLVTSLPDEYLKRIESIIYNGMQSGRYPTAIAKELQKATGISWRRSKVIARDQMAKINSAVDSERSQNLGIEYYRWSTSSDLRVSGNPSGKYPKAKVRCYMIAKADIGFGRGVYTYKHGAEYAGEKNLQPGTAHVNCHAGTDTLDYIPPVFRIYKREYSGRLICLETAGGGRVVTTPNHPIFCGGYWKSAKDINVGDDILNVRVKGGDISYVNADNAKTTFVDLFDSCKVFFTGEPLRIVSGDFHGDAVINHDVDTVDIKRELMEAIEFTGLESFKEFNLALSNANTFGFADSDSSFHFGFLANLGASSGLISFLGSCASLLSGHLGHANDVCLGLSSHFNPSRFKDSNYWSSRGFKDFGDFKLGLSSGVHSANVILLSVCKGLLASAMLGNFKSKSPDCPAERVGPESELCGDLSQSHSRVVKIESFHSDTVGDSFHVYNLETKCNWYVVNSTLSHNCRCRRVPLIEGVNWERPRK